MLFSLTKLKKLKGNEKLPFTGLGTIARTKTARSFFLFTPAESLPALALGLFTERATSRLRNPAPVLVLDTRSRSGRSLKRCVQPGTGCVLRLRQGDERPDSQRALKRLLERFLKPGRKNVYGGTHFEGAEPGKTPDLHRITIYCLNTHVAGPV